MLSCPELISLFSPIISKIQTLKHFYRYAMEFTFSLVVLLSIENNIIMIILLSLSNYHDNIIIIYIYISNNIIKFDNDYVYGFLFGISIALDNSTK